MLVSLLLSLALAQSPDRPTIVSSSVAWEAGPGALWVNPANIAYDADRRVGIYVHQALEDGPRSIAATAGIGSLGIGAHSFTDEFGDSRWTLDYASGIELPERLAIGWRIAWHVGAPDGNYVAYDGGAGWRPFPWFGLGVAFHNMGSPHGTTQARSTMGLALRPFGEALTLGFDFARQYDAASDDIDHVALTARFRPIEGLYLRGGIANPIDGLDNVEYSLGIEVFFNGVGGGVSTDTAWAGDGVSALTAFVGTDEPGETLVRSGRRVAAAPVGNHPYQPAQPLFLEPERSWLETLELLRQVEDDPTMRGAVITLGSGGMSFARYQELRARLVTMREAGKAVLVYLQGAPGNGAYYVASAATRVVIHPAAELRLIGLSAEMTYLGGTMDLLGVQPQFVRRSEYKAAVEQYTAHEASAASLEQMEALLDDNFEVLVREISGSRGVSEEVVREWIDGGPWPAAEAKELGLVDGVLYPDMLEAELDRMHGGPVRIQPVDRLAQPHSPWEEASRIAVIYVDGVITGGPSSPGGLLGARTAGSATLVRQLLEAADDPTVRAVVLRVDSPGGSAYASDEIWRATQLVRREGKPVVVSMGGVAASGGYYVSAGADLILAEPTTITGSIGVYSGKFAVEGLADKLGVQTTSIRRGRNANLESMFTPWDGVQAARMEALVESTYDQFKSRVEEGRRMTPEQVEAVAKGRVWSGTRAAEVGLVDELGGLQDAVLAARRLAGIPERRKIALISYSPSAAPLEGLAPSLVQAFVPLPLLQSWERSLTPAEVALPPELGTALTLSSQSDLVWALDPALLHVEVR
ncbi:MAG: signal peptide peptidase SppA [Deltaproteobacteria bacterium]|nr:MAG: signal peptide peptidase SppA [Deltaproteobacteria bacterium]